MTARCDIRRSGPGGSVCGGERRARCGSPSCRQGQGKGTDNGNKGTDNRSKGTDNRSKGTDNRSKDTDNRSKAKVLLFRRADEAKACCCAQLRRD
jgi:hypothetical protein